MTSSPDSLPNPDDVARVDAALASLGLDIAQAADNDRVAALATSLFTTASELPSGIEVPTVVEDVNRALDAHAMYFLLPGQFSPDEDALTMQKQPTKED